MKESAARTLIKENININSTKSRKGPAVVDWIDWIDFGRKVKVSLDSSEGKPAPGIDRKSVV